MTTDIRVKCFSFINFHEIPPNNIYLIPQNPIFANDLNAEAQTLYQTLISYQNDQQKSSRPIQKIYSQSGVWYCILKQQNSINLLVSTEYPIAASQRLLKKIEELLKDKVKKGSSSKDISQYETQITELLNNYDNNPYTDDKLDMTAKSVDSVQGLMEENIKRMQINQQQLEVVHHKSHDINQVANNFQKNATQVKYQMSWQTYLLYGGAALIIGGVTIYFLIKIF